MTKFEEEFKALTSWNWVNVDLIQQILIRFGNWHSDEEFQKLLSKYSNLNDNYEKEVIRSSKLESQITGLKSQLQQQALPVVPECVAKYIERCKSYDCGLIWAIRPDRDANDNSEKVYDWLFPNGVKLPNGMYPNPYEPDNLVRPDKENQIKFVRAWLDGYQVEKPQLFYIELPNVYEFSDSVFVSKVENGTIVEFSSGKNYALKFTEQEIKSIYEHYWQFAVPVEDNK